MDHFFLCHIVAEKGECMQMWLDKCVILDVGEHLLLVLTFPLAVKIRDLDFASVYIPLSFDSTFLALFMI